MSGSSPIKGMTYKGVFQQEWASYDAIPTNRFDLLLKLERDMEDEEKLREVFPALQSAWDHYQIMLRMCRDHLENDAE